MLRTSKNIERMAEPFGFCHPSFIALAGAPKPGDTNATAGRNSAVFY
jgi:hypothetical protein